MWSHVVYVFILRFNNVPVNNFTAMAGLGHRFLGINLYSVE